MAQKATLTPAMRIGTPEVTLAIHRRAVSSPASGPAASAALIAARLIPRPPAGAPTSAPTPVTSIERCHGTS